MTHPCRAIVRVMDYRACLCMIVISACLLLGGAVQAGCRQALALGLDVSGSVDAREYRLQLDGLAQALGDRDVRDAILSLPEMPIRLMVFEWSGLVEQRVIVPWTEIDSGVTLARISATLSSTRQRAAQDSSTAIAAAMRFGARELMRQADCLQRTLDISGDGPANIGAHPRDVPDSHLGDVTVNALVVLPFSRANTTKNLSNVKTLEDYYESFVLRGPGAFTEAADDYTDFARAMRRKLLREVQLPGLSTLRDNPGRPARALQ
ncbi:MAG: DUF1194 domain-containing protein [Pseudomonadota bacterium]